MVTNYPIAFLTKANILFKKHPTEISADGTPRYMVNAGATYSLTTCMKNYKPVYSKKEVKGIW